MQPTIEGTIFSDLGRAPEFMALDWVQEGLQRSLGFVPYPATLNVRPDNEQLWLSIKSRTPGVPLSTVPAGFCSARLYAVSLRALRESGATIECGVLVPEVPGYPDDKIEIVAPVRLKEALGVKDGDRLLLEFHA